VLVNRCIRSPTSINRAKSETSAFEQYLLRELAPGCVKSCGIRILLNKFIWAPYCLYCLSSIYRRRLSMSFCRCFSVDFKCRHCAGDVWGMVEERNLQLAPPPGVQALDPLLQLQQNLAALNQVRILTLSFRPSRTSPLLTRSEF
jgi:hypothetical protein